MQTLADAIRLAVEAHRHQLDKAGAPYYLHPLRVMLTMDSEEEMMVAVLHDLLEDTPHTPATLRTLGYPEHVLHTLDLLSRREDESYDQFIDRLKPDPLARRVKLADLEDNMDITRLADITEKDLARLQRYLKAWRTLRAATQGR